MQRTGYRSRHPSGNNVEFAETSVCRYLDILRYPNQSEPVQEEGGLTDSSMASWFDRVGVNFKFIYALLIPLTSVTINPPTESQGEPLCGVRILSV